MALSPRPQDLCCPLSPPSPFLPHQQCLPPLGEEVKQADVVLLGYPVPFPLSPCVRRTNLEIYEAVTSPQGPAMTWVRRLWGVGGGPHVAPALPSAALASVFPPHTVGLPSACPLTSDPRACLPWAGWS